MFPCFTFAFALHIIGILSSSLPIASVFLLLMVPMYLALLFLSDLMPVAVRIDAFSCYPFSFVAMILK